MKGRQRGERERTVTIRAEVLESHGPPHLNVVKMLATFGPFSILSATICIQVFILQYFLGSTA